MFERKTTKVRATGRFGAAVLLLAVLGLCFCGAVHAQTAETDSDQESHYRRMIPGYDDMLEDRILIGTTKSGDEIYEFDGLNPLYDNGGSFRLMDPAEVESDMKRRGISFKSVAVRTVMAKRFLVIELADGSNYGLDLLRTTDDMGYVTMESFRVFCMHYFGWGYDFYGE